VIICQYLPLLDQVAGKVRGSRLVHCGINHIQKVAYDFCHRSI